LQNVFEINNTSIGGIKSPHILHLL